ncbi:MAG: hypothetical protein RIS29_1911, partial [Bacteroidota bacterium]
YIQLQNNVKIPYELFSIGTMFVVLNAREKLFQKKIHFGIQNKKMMYLCIDFE